MAASLTEVNNHAQHTATIAVKQLFPRCQPMQSVSIVVQLATGRQVGGFTETVRGAGWTKIDVFDGSNRVVSGRWKTPVRIEPVRPDLSTAEMNTIPQLHLCDLYYRLINARDVNKQDGIVLVPQLIASYRYPPIEYGTKPVLDVPLKQMISPYKQTDIVNNLPNEFLGTSTFTQMPPRVASRKKPKSPAVDTPEVFVPRDPSPKPVERQPIQVHQPPSPSTKMEVRQSTSPLQLPESPYESPSPIPPSPPAIPSLPSLTDTVNRVDFGMQIDKLIGGPTEECRIQVTLYQPDGKVAYYSAGAVAFATEYIRPTFLKGVHVYGLQEVLFESVPARSRSVFVFEIYMIDSDGGYVDVKNTRQGPEESLIAWAVHPLFHLTPRSGRRSQISTRLDTSQNRTQDRIITGRIDLPLYEPPMPNIRELIDHQKLHRIELRRDQIRLNDSNLILHIYGGSVAPLGLPYPIPQCHHQDNSPLGAFIEHRRDLPPAKEFKNGMGFDVYIDDGRFFPECCVASKVNLCLYDEKYKRIGKDYESTFNLDTWASSPSFNERFEFRDATYDPTATLFFTVTMLDAVDQRVTILGYAILPAFVKTHTFTRPSADVNKFCLNEGAFQLRIYRRRIEEDVFSEKSFEEIVPCASLLVRIVNAACHQDGEAKRAVEFPKDEWEAEGLIEPKPAYEDGCYESISCIPTIYENRLFHSFVNKQPVAVRKTTRAIADAKKGKTDQGLQDWLATKFRGNLSAEIFDLSCLTKYDSDSGIAFSVEKCQNTPWNGFTFATYCLSPPASFYLGSLEDPAVLVTKLNLEGLIRQPRWSDGLKVFPRRQYHQNLVVVVHLYEMIPDTKNEGEFIVGQQAWTLIPVCNGQFSNYGFYQVGLFQGAPSETLIQAILDGPLEPTVTSFRKKKVMKLMDSASLYVRLGDARKKEQLEKEKLINRRFLPRGNKYINENTSKPFRSIMPAGQNLDSYSRHLTTKFMAHVQRAFDARVKEQHQA